MPLISPLMPVPHCNKINKSIWVIVADVNLLVPERLLSSSNSMRALQKIHYVDVINMQLQKEVPQITSRRVEMTESVMYITGKGTVHMCILNFMICNMTHQCACVFTR